MTSKLTSAMYITSNVTKRSLDGPPQSVIRLKDVPAYRLSINCRPNLPNRIQIRTVTVSDTAISLTWESKGIDNSTSLYAMTSIYSGAPHDIGTGEKNSIVYAAFAGYSQEVYLGFLTRFN